MQESGKDGCWYITNGYVFNQEPIKTPVKTTFRVWGLFLQCALLPREVSCMGGGGEGEGERPMRDGSI